ncbi:MAG: primosomal protein N' [Mariprofundaceae bacterium]|nr:primosomal protein N' [Mariprofundaceae bacterium]
MYQLFTYQWPFSDVRAAKGMRVLVPFGKTRRMAVVMAVRTQCDLKVTVKSVLDVLDETPLYSELWWSFFSRMQAYYLVTPALMFAGVYAWAGSDEQQQFYCADLDALAELDIELAALFKHRKTKRMNAIAKKVDDAWLRVRRACLEGVLQAVLPSLEQRQTVEPHLVLKPDQVVVLGAILAGSGFAPSLLFGATGSGKTEVYLRAICHYVAQGNQVLVLVPEIGLVPQWLAYLDRYCACVGQWHSSMNISDRLAVRLNLDKVNVVVGTRSALFLPLPRLAMIIVDEEHDGSFKQQEGMRYSARDMAILLAQTLQLPIVLGSATPSLESWYQAKQGKYQLLRLAERIQKHVLVKPEIVDLRHKREPINVRLIQALEKTKSKGQQSLLYLNRRGYAPSLYCCDCTHIVQCPWCSRSLTLHLKQNKLRCHSCGFKTKTITQCAECQSESLVPLGVGTERVLEQLKEALPELRVEVLDRDRVSSEKVLHQLLDDFKAGDIDCLVGTQMLVKGHHFPNVTLVGVVHADLGLNMPDFRAEERWWQQLTQVLGRAGRGEHAGRVMIQTLQPDAQWLFQLGDPQAESVLDKGLLQRQQFSYPPFARWVRIVFSAIFLKDALQAAQSCVEHLGKQSWKVEVIGPMPCVFERQAGRFRYEVLLKDASRRYLPWCLQGLESALPTSAKVRRIIDVDPYDMM